MGVQGIPLTFLWIAELCGRSNSHFLRNFHTVFHSSHTNFPSHQQCVRVSISLHHCQYLLCFVFFMIAILTGLRWHLIVVLIHISLIISDVEHLFMFVIICITSFFFFFETECRCCYPDWRAMARSRLTATSASWVQAILLFTPPE